MFLSNGVISNEDDSFLSGYESNGYADDADKADERGFKRLRYTINKLKSAFVRLIRVVRVSIDSCLHQK